MPNLYPVFDAPAVFSRDRQRASAPRYKKAPLFNFETGDFVVDGAGKVPFADGYTAWWQWCVKAAVVERFAYPIYPRSYGTEIDRALAQNDRGLVEAALQKTISESELTDRRTRSVTNWKFRWVADNLYVSFTVSPTVGTAYRRTIEVFFGA